MKHDQPEIKFCGLATPDDIIAALDLSADYIGLVFFPKSPRHLSVERAAVLANQARGRSRIVALVVDADNDLIDTLMQQVRPDFLQLHGHETDRRIQEIKHRTGCPVIKAIGVQSVQDIKDALRLPLDMKKGDLLLFDAKPANTGNTSLPGGNGIAFDWDYLRTAPLPEKYMLAGGLTPENVATALAQTGAPVLDVSSGIEDSPGHKNPERMRLFAQNARKPRKPASENAAS